MGDNASRRAPMNADDQTTSPARKARLARGATRRPRLLARYVLLRVARPYMIRRAREAESAAALVRVQAELEHLQERHCEQIERLEDLARELVATAEALRQRVADLEQRDSPRASESAHDVEGIER